MSSNRLRYKVVLVGDSGVGKTSLTSRFARDQFSPQFHSTVGVELASRTLTIEGRSIEAQLWDTPGKERYRGVMGAYYGGAHGVVLVYDTTRHATFEACKRWADDLRDHGVGAGAVMLVGNKCDLGQLRAVTTDEGRGFANANGMSFMEVSALDGTSVDLAFQILLTEVLYQSDKGGGGGGGSGASVGQGNNPAGRVQPQPAAPGAPGAPKATGNTPPRGLSTPMAPRHSSHQAAGAPPPRNADVNNQHPYQQQQQQQQHNHRGFNNNNNNNNNNTTGFGGGGGGASGGTSYHNASMSSAPPDEIVRSYMAWEQENRRSLAELTERAAQREQHLVSLVSRASHLASECDAARDREARTASEVRELEERLARARAAHNAAHGELESIESELAKCESERAAEEALADEERTALSRARAAVDDGLNALLARANTFRREAMGATSTSASASSSPPQGSLAHGSSNINNINNNMNSNMNNSRVGRSNGGGSWHAGRPVGPNTSANWGAR